LKRFAKLFPTRESRNFGMNIIEGALYIASGAFLSPHTVLPALITRLGGSNLIVGALPVIIYGGAFLPQLFAARYVETHPWKRPWVVSTGIPQRMVILLIAVAIAVLGGGYHALALGFLVGLLTLNQVLVGISTPAWFDLFAKLTPFDRRGRLLGIRNSLGGAWGLLASLLLTWLLATLAFPYSYAVGLFMAFLLQMGSVFLLSRLQEAEPSRVVERRPFFEYLERLPMVLKQNREFRRFLISCALLTVANMPLGFFTVYALTTWSVGEEVVGQFTLSIVAVQVVSALAIGFLMDRRGNKVALMLAGGAVALASTVAALAPSLWAFRIVFVLAGVNLGTELMTRYNLAIEYGPPEQRSTYIGLMNTVLAPFYLSGIAAGWIVDRFGFPVMFLLSLVCSLAGLYMLAFRVKEPRRVKSAPLT
jgi:MFS family permease